MKTLKSVLEQEVLRWERTGGQPSSALQALQGYRRRTFWLLVIQFGMLIIASGLSALLAATFNADTKVITALIAGSAALAGAFAGLIGTTWGSWSRAGLVLQILDQSTEQEIRSEVLRLIPKL